MPGNSDKHELSSASDALDLLARQPIITTDTPISPAEAALTAVSKVDELLGDVKQPLVVVDGRRIAAGAVGAGVAIGLVGPASEAFAMNVDTPGSTGAQQVRYEAPQHPGITVRTEKARVPTSTTTVHPKEGQGLADVAKDYHESLSKLEAANPQLERGHHFNLIYVTDNIEVTVKDAPDQANAVHIKAIKIIVPPGDTIEHQAKVAKAHDVPGSIKHIEKIIERWDGVENPNTDWIAGATEKVPRVDHGGKHREHHAVIVHFQTNGNVSALAHRLHIEPDKIDIFVERFGRVNHIDPNLVYPHTDYKLPKINDLVAHSPHHIAALPKQEHNSPKHHKEHHHSNGHLSPDQAPHPILKKALHHLKHKHIPGYKIHMDNLAQSIDFLMNGTLQLPAAQACAVAANIPALNLSAAQASGVNGNFAYESTGINPHQHQYGGGPGRGVGQWEVGGRFDALQRFADSCGLDPESLDTQLLFAAHELTSDSFDGLDVLRTTTTPEEAAIVFEQHFERAGSPSLEERAQRARAIYEALQGCVQQAHAEDGRGHQDGGSQENLPNGIAIMNQLKAEHDNVSGELDASELDRIGDPWGDMKLNPTAAVAFRDMNQTFNARFGHNIELNYAYRSYAEQVQLRAEKGIFAAVPGHSVHGWGLAIDMQLNSEEYNWMVQHGAEFGFVNPAWAHDGTAPDEAWHWEFYGSAAGNDSANSNGWHHGHGNGDHHGDHHDNGHHGDHGDNNGGGGHDGHDNGNGNGGDQSGNGDHGQPSDPGNPGNGNGDGNGGGQDGSQGGGDGNPGGSGDTQPTPTTTPSADPGTPDVQHDNGNAYGHDNSSHFGA